MTRLGFMVNTTSERALSAADDTHHNAISDGIGPISDFSSITALESHSILGAHDGTLPDDLMDLLEGMSA
jgi:hypothetical protein